MAKLKAEPQEPTKPLPKDQESKRGQELELENGGKILILPNGNKTGVLPTSGLGFEVRPRKLKDTRSLEHTMGGSKGVSQFIEEASLRLFLLLLEGASFSIGDSEKEKLDWLFNNMPEHPDGLYLIDTLFNSSKDQNASEVEITERNADEIMFKSGHIIKVGDEGERICEFPVSKNKAVFRPALMGDASAISRSMGGAEEKQKFPVDAMLRLMSRLCKTWNGTPKALTTSILGELEEGKDTQYLSEIYLSFRGG